MKVEAGLCEGEVLHHTFSKLALSVDFILSLPHSLSLTLVCGFLLTVHKSKKEQRTLKKKIEDAKRLRAERRHQQEANVARKRRERELHRQQSMKGVIMGEGGDGVEGEKSEEEDDDDVEWYRQEVGQEPDPGELLTPTLCYNTA